VIGNHDEKKDLKYIETNEIVYYLDARVRIICQFFKFEPVSVQKKGEPLGVRLFLK
jgi:hypothetical protein